MSGTLSRYLERGWCRLEAVAALCPKRFDGSGAWRPGPLNLRFRLHQVRVRARARVRVRVRVALVVVVVVVVVCTLGLALLTPTLTAAPEPGGRGRGQADRGGRPARPARGGPYPLPCPNPYLTLPYSYPTSLTGPKRRVILCTECAWAPEARVAKIDTSADATIPIKIMQYTMMIKRSARVNTLKVGEDGIVGRWLAG